MRVIPFKRSFVPQNYISPELAKLILYFIGFSIFWLLFGTTVGEYLGIKFVAPDADHVSWLSFGRLRPVHTNMVFWGWASFAMVGLSYYVIPRVSNIEIHSLKIGWYTLILMNVAVLAGTISLMAGINNGGGEYREYIYSYSLGILAFWTQIIFYTLIGSHHFIFSAIPWWMQTVAIVASVGMVIPVVAGTANFLLTFNGAWYQLKTSYTLPFYLIGIIFYFTGSMQGTVEAFRFTNLIWHFTDFTVAHSHLTMYGIITFMLWAFIYTLVPRITGKEPPKISVGIHFWLALIGLMFYTVPLMIGATEKGLLWMDNKPFIQSVVLMAPYWLWRAIGGTMMWISHFVFAYNFYKMVNNKQEVIIPRTPAEILEAKRQLKNTEFIPTK